MSAKKNKDAVRIKSKSKTGFRRAGIQFTPEFQDIDVDELSDEQKNLLEQELSLEKQSNLIIESDDKKSDTKNKSE